MARGVCIVLAMVGLAWALASCAKTAPGPSTPLTAVARKTATGEVPVHILSERHEYVIDEKGGYRNTLERKYRIETLSGVESWAETGSPWSPWYQARPEIRANVRSPEGSVLTLDPRTIAEHPAHPGAPDIYSDRRLLVAPLPGVALGSIVHETIVTKTTKPFFAGGSGHYVVIQTGIPRDKVEISIDVPADAAFEYVKRDVELQVRDTRQGNRRKLVLSGGPFAAIEPVEPLVPSDVAEWPHVQFTTARSWNQLARAYEQLVDAKLRNASVDEAAKRSINPDDSPLVKANKLLDWVRGRVRYAGIEFGEASIMPRLPGETLQRGYGDCKDQSLLLVALLRSVDVDAKLALLRTGPGEDVLEKLPALNGFDHAIVTIPGSTPIWIDPTSPYARAAELPSPDQGRLALVIDASTERLVRTPESTAQGNGYRELREIALGDFGPGRVVETSSATGDMEQRVRGSFDGPPSGVREQMTKYVSGEYAADELVRVEHPPVLDLGKPFRIRLEAAKVRKAQTGIFDAYVVLDQAVLFGWLPELLFDDSPRKHDLVLNLPYRAEIAYRISPPEGFSAAPLPVRPPLTLGPAKLERSFTVAKDGAIHATLVLDIGKRRWTAADVQAFKEARKRLDAESLLGVSFDHAGQKLIEARRATDGLAVFRKRAAAEPKLAIHRTRLAVALSGLGFGEAARREGRRAVALEPNNPIPHRWLGTILQGDQFGRSYYPGYDRTGALAAMRKAAELDPSDVPSRVDVAVLLEHDANGERYRDKAALGEAVQIYDALDPKALAELDDGNFRHNALFALTYAGRFAEVEQRLRTLSPGDTPANLAIIASTVLSGPVSGISRADSLGLRGDARSQALTNAGEILVGLRRYTEGASLISAAAPSSSSSLQLTNRSRLLAKVKVVDPASMKSDTPSRLVAKALATYVASDEVSDAVRRQLFSARALAGDKPQLPDWFQGFGVGFRKTPAASREVVVDTLVAMIDSRSEGDDRAGYKVDTNLSAPGSAPNRFNLYVVREGGAYRIRCAGDDVGELGTEALFHANRGDVKAARRWLDWAKPHVRAGSGQDPLRAPPFIELYADGKGDPKLAAAALCASGSCAKEARELLQAALKKASSDAERTAIEHALAFANYRLKDDRAALDNVRALRRRHPASKVTDYLETAILWQAKRFREYRDLVRKLLAKGDEEREYTLRTALAEVHEKLGQLEEAKAARQTLIDRGKADDNTYNNRAWLSLFVGKVTEEDVGYALQAAQLSQFRSASAMHTLASLYAEVGKTEEAWQTFLKLLELRPKEQPIAVDWYVVGRIAEHYQLVDDAREAYRRVTALGDEYANSTQKLAARRLAALE